MAKVKDKNANMPNAIYHPSGEMRIVLDSEYEEMLGSGEWFKSPVDAKAQSDKGWKKPKASAKPSRTVKTSKTSKSAQGPSGLNDNLDVSADQQNLDVNADMGSVAEGSDANAKTSASGINQNNADKLNPDISNNASLEPNKSGLHDAQGNPDLAAQSDLANQDKVNLGEVKQDGANQDAAKQDEAKQKLENQNLSNANVDSSKQLGEEDGLLKK